MHVKISKKIKKIVFGVLGSTIVVSLLIFFGSTQNDITGATRNAADSIENIFYDLFFKAVTNDEQENVNAGKFFINSQDSLKNAEGNSKGPVPIGTATIKLSENYDPGIFIVDIDEVALSKLGPYNEWDRFIHADVVNNLNNGGAAAIAFDIMFKTADFGEGKAKQAMNLLKKVNKEENWDSLYPSILANYNYDSMLVKAVKDGGVSIVCDMFDEAKSYKFESQWRPLSTDERAKSIDYKSAININQVDKIENVEAKDLLDNVFPELARAGAQMGSVNAYPDNDGVLRRISMLYQFPNPDLYPDEKRYVYSTMSLMTVMHLFHQKPENLKIKMGEHINLGKPFGIYKDSSGTLHTTYPNFSYPMFRALRAALLAKDIKKKATNDIIDITSRICITKNDDGTLNLELMEGQVLSSELSMALLKVTKEMLKAVSSGEEIEVSEGIILKKDLESDDSHRYVLVDVENDDEAYINRYIVNTLEFFKDSIPNIVPNRPTHLSMDMDLRYDAKKMRWHSSIPILKNDVIRDIQKLQETSVVNLKNGQEIRFGNEKKIPIDKQGRFRVNYKGRYNTDESMRVFKHHSYYDVSKQRVDPIAYQGKIFILGSAAPALFDFVNTPHEEHFPAVLLHATIIKNILEDDYLVILDEHTQIIIILLIALLCIILGLFLKGYLSAVISLILSTIYIIVAYQYFKNGLYIGVSRQILTIVLIDAITLAVQFYFENKEKSFLNNAFKQYISPVLIDEMVKSEKMPILGGDKSNITAYFTDIQSFSTFSEKIGDPKKLVDLLNEYLTKMTDTLLGNKGTLDKYEGDAIIAFFGAPMPLPNHAQNACNTAVDMQRKLMKLRKKWTNEGDKWPKVVHDMHMRIGINSGDIVTGNMGSTMRKNYTMMGDAVNLAARLESAAKQYGAYIQISEDTQKALDENTFIYRSLDIVRVVGKTLPVKTFELLEKTGCENEDKLKRLVEIWEKARQCYLSMKWDEAIELFTQCLDLEPHHPERDPGSKTSPSHVYIKRCQNYKKNPPVPEGEIWDGVFTATEK